MKLKKTLGLPVAASALAATAGFAPAVNADIELGEGLTVTGFVDMSFVYYDEDDADESEQVFGVDQFEMDFMYSGSNGVSAQVDIEYGESGGGSGSDETFVEQAFITKQLSDSFSVKAGRFLSYSGWETEEPTGLYQYSGTGYGGVFYGGYQQGVSGMYDGETFDFMVSVVNDAFDPNENDAESLEVEIGFAIQPVEGLTAKLFFIDDSGNDDYQIINFWTSYETGPWTFAFEYNMAEADSGEGDGGLLMASYSGDSWGITGRYHDFTIEDGAGNTTFENSAITIAPFFPCGDHLTIMTELRLDEYGPGGSPDGSTSLAVEALFVF